jgi:hypothetical protein
MVFILWCLSAFAFSYSSHHYMRILDSKPQSHILSKIQFPGFTNVAYPSEQLQLYAKSSSAAFEFDGNVMVFGNDVHNP